VSNRVVQNVSNVVNNWQCSLYHGGSEGHKLRPRPYLCLNKQMPKTDEV